jgi:hypothetical protein
MTANPAATVPTNDMRRTKTEPPAMRRRRVRLLNDTKNPTRYRLFNPTPTLKIGE